MKNQFFLSFSYIYFQEDELRKGELEADKDKMMREYRAQLDAERATKLALGRNHSGSKSNHKKGRLRNRELFFLFLFFLFWYFISSFSNCERLLCREEG